jgi:hypothetical protein
MSRRSWWRLGGPSRADSASELHWTRAPDRPAPARGHFEDDPSLAMPEAPRPIPYESRPSRRKRTAEAVVGSLIFHIVLLWAAGTMVPGVRQLPLPETPDMQVTLVEPIPPIEVQPPPELKLRELEQPQTAPPPSSVPSLRPAQRPPTLETPKELARPTPPRALSPLVTPTAPTIPEPAPVPAATPPAPPVALPKIIKAPPSKLEDLNLHNTPTPAPQLRPQLTLPAPPSFGQPGGGPPGSAAPGSGPAGTAAPGGTASGQGVIGNGGGGCSKATLPLLSAAEQERCRVQAALQAAAALRNMKAGDRNSSPLDSLGDKRVVFNEERAARAEREAAAGALLGRMNKGVGPTPPRTSPTAP